MVSDLIGNAFRENDSENDKIIYSYYMKIMRKILLLLLVFVPLISIGQVDIRIGMEGMKHNSIVMLNAMCECLGQNRVYHMLDSLSYFGLFMCEIDKNGLIVDIPKYRTKKSSFCEDDLLTIKKYLIDHRVKFSVVYVNDLGEDECLFKKGVQKDLKHFFKHNKTKIITVGFPGYLSAPWERFRVYNPLNN